MNKPHWSKLIRTAALVLPAAAVFAQSPVLPDAPGRDTVQRVCGACHPATVVLGRGRTREEWGQVVANMISRGAKGTPADFASVTDYLAKNITTGQSNGKTTSPRRVRRGFSMGPDDKQIVDTEAAERGRAVYMSDCGSCHGPLARGAKNGPDLVRSLVVLHDRYGSTLQPYLQGQHPSVEGKPIAKLTGDQIKDISHFLHQQVDNTLRSGPYTKVLNVMTGDAAAGAAYFSGAGGCGACHSATGDLAGIASRYDPPTLQQRLLFPRTAAPGSGGAVAAEKPVTVKVTPENGESLSGTLVHIDDFTIALRDAAGTYYSWNRTPGLKIERNDPYAAHDELLDKLTDKDVHDLVAYLETLK
ncbi:MAG TPA: c-type cytochrome [Bryobacteraceae bacterium]